MRCPYCTTEIAAEALVCPTCSRELYLLKPMLEKVGRLEEALETETKKVAALETEMARLTTIAATVTTTAMAGTAAAPPPAPSSPRSYLASALLALVPTLLLLVAAHGILLFVYDVKPLYLRIASILIPILFGFALHVWHPRRIWLSGVLGFVMAGCAVLLMLTVTSRIDKVPLLPQDIREMREMFEYIASIGLAFLTGLLLGKLRYHRLSLAPRPSRLTVFIAQLFATDAEGQMGIERLAKRIQKFAAAASPVIAGAISFYTGVKALLGDGS